MADKKYVLYDKHVTAEDGVRMFSFDFSKKEDALLAIDGARQASLEYEDMVQDVDTQFYEKEGQCVIDVSTYKGNYADSYDEYLLTDENGNQIDITWSDVDSVKQNYSYISEDKSMSKVLKRGKVGGMDWKITDRGELIFGKEGESQTFDLSNYDYQFMDETTKSVYDNLEFLLYPYSDIGSGNKWFEDGSIGDFDGQAIDIVNFYPKENITSIKMDGPVKFTGSMSHFFYVSREPNDSNTVYDSVTSVDLSKADMSEVKDVSCLFSECENLREVNLTGTNIPKDCDTSNMFNGCKNLKSVRGWSIFRNISSKNVFDRENPSKQTVRIFGDKGPINVVIDRKFISSSGVGRGSSSPDKYNVVLPEDMTRVTVESKDGKRRTLVSTSELLEKHEASLKRSKEYVAKQESAKSLEDTAVESDLEPDV